MRLLNSNQSRTHKKMWLKQKPGIKPTKVKNNAFIRVCHILLQVKLVDDLDMEIEIKTWTDVKQNI